MCAGRAAEQARRAVSRSRPRRAPPARPPTAGRRQPVGGRRRRRSRRPASPSLASPPCGSSAAERLLGRLGQVVVGWRREPAPAAAPPSAPRRRSPPCQSSSSTRVTAAGRCAALRRRGRPRARPPAAFGGRVGAADPGRVVGREGGIAELFGRCSAVGRLLFGLGRAAARVGAGADLGSAWSEPPPPSIAATMKTTATSDEPGDRLQRGGTGLRRRFGRRRGSASRPRAPRRRPARPGRLDGRRSAAGTSALIGRFGPRRKATRRAAGWPVS